MWHRWIQWPLEVNTSLLVTAFLSTSFSLIVRSSSIATSHLFTFPQILITMWIQPNSHYTDSIIFNLWLSEIIVSVMWMMLIYLVWVLWDGYRLEWTVSQIIIRVMHMILFVHFPFPIVHLSNQSRWIVIPSRIILHSVYRVFVSND